MAVAARVVRCNEFKLRSKFYEGITVCDIIWFKTVYNIAIIILFLNEQIVE